MTIQEIGKSLNVEAREFTGNNGERALAIESNAGNGIDFYLDDNLYIEWTDGNSMKANEPELMGVVEEVVRQWIEIKS